MRVRPEISGEVRKDMWDIFQREKFAVRFLGRCGGENGGFMVMEVLYIHFQQLY